MQIPPSTDPVWHRLVLGKTKPEFKFLAAKILLTRLIRDVKNDPSYASILKCSEQIRAVFVTYEKIPNAKHDLQFILQNKWD